LEYEFTAKAGVYSATWSDAEISIRIDRIREDSRQNVTGEITIRGTGPVGGLLHQARLNLTATRSRKEVAQACEDRHPVLELSGWLNCIEIACLRTLEAHREGEPLHFLTDEMDEDASEFRVDPLIWNGQPTLCYGAGGLGKSLFAVYLSVLVASGVPTTKLTPEPGNVLYLDYESDVRTWHRRAESISQGLDVDPHPIVYRRSAQPLQSEAEVLQRIVAEQQIDLVVVDSGGPACGGIPEASENTLQFFSALRSLGCASLIVGHVAKKDGGRSGPFGSVYWTNISRSVWEIAKTQELEQDYIEFALTHRKTNEGRLHKPLAYRIDFAPGKTEFTNIDIKSNSELSKSLPTGDRITEALKQSAKKAEALSEELDIPVNNVQVVLSRGKGKRYTQVGDGFWGNLAREY